jgi:hypothetical protein
VIIQLFVIINFTHAHSIFIPCLGTAIGFEQNHIDMGRQKQLIILDQTGRLEDLKNCGWQFYVKTGALSFILVDAYGTIWSIKFLSNSPHVIRSYFDKLLGVKTLCLRAKNCFEKLDGAYAAFLDEYQGSYKPSGNNVLSWKNPWAIFLDCHCCWSMQKDTGDNDIEYTCILLPTIIVHVFWLSPAVHILCKMKSKGLEEEKLLKFQSCFCPREGSQNIQSHIIVQERSQIGQVLVDADSSTLHTLLGGLLFKSNMFELVVPHPGKGVG